MDCGDIKSPGIIQIPPKLKLANKLIRIDSIKLLSVVSKWIGTACQWPKFFAEFSKVGYNMIHFTPLQRRGLSNSPYSIFDHLELSEDLGTDLNGLEHLIQTAETDYSLLSMTDIVWNHISCDSPHLKSHPEIGYNLENSPHLKLAFDLDEGIMHFSRELKSLYNLDPDVRSEAHLGEIMKIFIESHLPKLKLWEYFVLDVGHHVKQLEEMIRERSSPLLICSIDGSPQNSLFDPTLIIKAIKNDGKFSRFSKYADMDEIAKLYSREIKEIASAPTESERSIRISKLLTGFRAALDAVNLESYKIYDEKIQRIYNNISARVKYERLDPSGPRSGAISENSPLVATYFTRIRDQNGNIMAFANNGWIWNADPLVNFAESRSDAYFCRDVIIWGDCVKLRYGQCRDDNPWIWDYMTKYTCQMVSVFHALRIDNCHSTPIHVAEYLLRKAREVRPELYVCAELFTGSPERDLQFIQDLGLNSLIREAMASWSVNDLGRNTVEYGGHPLGSFTRSGVDYKPHALFADCTHDNETPSQRRTAIEALPNSALVAMSKCAIASVLGYDMLVPNHLNIVKDTRHFDSKDMYLKGIGPAKQKLYSLHDLLSEKGYSQVYGNEFEGVITLIRENPVDRESYLCLTYHAFAQALAKKGFILNLSTFLLIPVHRFRVGI